jgi:hypothetical protein
MISASFSVPRFAADFGKFRKGVGRRGKRGAPADPRSEPPLAKSGVDKHSPIAPARRRRFRKRDSRRRWIAVRTAVAAVEGNTSIIREARAARPIWRCLPRHPRAAALQRPGGQACPWGLRGPEQVHREGVSAMPQLRVYCCIAVSEVMGQQETPALQKTNTGVRPFGFGQEQTFVRRRPRSTLAGRSAAPDCAP